MLLPVPLDPISAAPRREDEAPLLTRNGFSAFGGLTPHFFWEQLRSQQTSSISALRSWQG